MTDEKLEHLIQEYFLLNTLEENHEFKLFKEWNEKKLNKIQKSIENDNKSLMQYEEIKKDYKKAFYDHKKNVFNKNLKNLEFFLLKGNCIMHKVTDVKEIFKKSFNSKVIFNLLNFSNINSAQLDIILDMSMTDLTNFMNKFVFILQDKPQEDLNKILLPSNINDNNKLDKFFKYIENLTIKDIFNIDDENIDKFKKEFSDLMEKNGINGDMNKNFNIMINKIDCHPNLYSIFDAIRNKITPQITI